MAGRGDTAHTLCSLGFKKPSTPLFEYIGICSRWSGSPTSEAPSAASTWSSRTRSRRQAGTLSDIRHNLLFVIILYGSRGMLTTFKSAPIFGRLIARPGDGQHGDEVEADLLHPQPWRPHPVQPRPHRVHRPQEVTLRKPNIDDRPHQGGYEMQASTSRWSTSGLLQGGAHIKIFSANTSSFKGSVSGSRSAAGARRWAAISSKARSKWSRRGTSSTTPTCARPTARYKTCSQASRTWGWLKSDPQGLIHSLNSAKSKKRGAKMTSVVKLYFFLKGKKEDE